MAIKINFASFERTFKIIYEHHLQMFRTLLGLMVFEIFWPKTVCRLDDVTSRVNLLKLLDVGLIFLKMLWVNYSRFHFFFKSDFECLFVISECLLQSLEIRFEVCSDDLRWFNRGWFDRLVHLTSQLQLIVLDHRKSSQQTSKQTSELCNEHSELTNKHWKSDFKSKLKSRVSTKRLLKIEFHIDNDMWFAR
jgi:hypothetical protein